MSEEGAQAFYLRLNNHQGFMTGALAELYSNELMVDVTLTAEGQTIRAHQIVLAACSPYFKHIFLEYDKSSQYPIIIIKDMPFADLKAIVEFVYRGEITIPRQQLRSILANGAVLQIKGLHEFNRNNWSDAYSLNESIDDKNQFKSLLMNGMNGMNDMNGLNGLNDSNACEVKTSKKRTQNRTRKTINRSTNGSTGDKSVNYGHILSEENNSNDEITDNIKVKDINDCNNNENKKIIFETFDKNSDLNECKERLNQNDLENIDSLLNSNTNVDNNTENSMTANAVIRSDSIVAFNLLEQSMMIDVNSNVSINGIDATHQSDESSSSTGAASSASPTYTASSASPVSTPGLIPLYLNINSLAMIGTNAECVEQQNNKIDKNVEINNKIISDKKHIPGLEVRNKTESETNEKTSSSSTQTLAFDMTSKRSTRKRTQRVSKAGIPRKGNSIRSQKKFKCPVCQKVYVSPQNMREHLKNTHTNPDLKYVCSVCQREYSWKHALDRHFKSKHSTN